MNVFDAAEVAKRLKNLRELLEIDTAQMAKVTGVSESEYCECESGAKDFSFNFLYNCANALHCDLTELITGDSAKLQSFTVTKAGDGMPIERRSGFRYLHLAAQLKGRIAEPFVVSVPYEASAEAAPILLSTHEGQEMDFVLEGSLKIDIDGHCEILEAGDSVYYDSGRPHGMVAAGGQPVKFLAIVMAKK